MPLNADSILDSVKKVIGFDFTYTAFDLDITIAINSVFSDLQQVGVGPPTGFAITDNTALWSSYTPRSDILNMAKLYMFLKVRMAFDPPPTSFALEAIQKQIDEHVFRINIAADKMIELLDQDPIKMDLAQASSFSVILTSSRSVVAPLNPLNQQELTLRVEEGGGGSFDLAWATGTGGFVLPVISGSTSVLDKRPGAVNTIKFRYDATDTLWHYVRNDIVYSGGGNCGSYTNCW